MSQKLPASLSGLNLNLEALDQLAPADRKRAERELLALEREFKRNPLLAYEPHAKQVVFHSPPFPALRAFFGGNRSGKTTAVVIDSIVQAVDREFVPGHLAMFKRWDAPFFCRFVTPDLTNTLEGVVLQKLRDYCPAEQLRGNSFDRAWDKVLRILRFKNGSWFQFFSNDQDRDKFGGAALHRVVYDEEPREDIRQECLMRLIDYGGEELFAMTPLSGMCVDVETQCLTRRGWKFHDELETGEPVLSYNAEAGVTEWVPLLGVYRDEAYDGPMLRTPGHMDSMFTPDHKWVTPRGLVAHRDLKKTDRAVVTGPHRNVNVDWFERDFLELVGWVLAEGSIVPNENKVVIYQSASRYPEHCETIERLIQGVGAQYHQKDNPYRTNPNGTTTVGTIRRFVITGDVARQLRWIVGWPKRLRPEFLTGLSAAGLAALLKGLLDGDGHRCASGKWEFTTRDRALADSVSMIGVLTGRRTNLRHFASRGETVWRVTASERSTISEFRRHAVPAEAPLNGVWCPCTQNHTWVARRGGTAYITGNSWLFDEVFEPWERGELEDGRVVIVDMDDNPHLDEAAKRRVLSGLTMEEREARKSGRFVHFAGLIYPEFSKARHVLPRPAPEDMVPQGAEVFCGIDPGFRHMAAVVFCYLDFEDTLVVFDEIALQGRTIRDLCKEIQLRNRRWDVAPRWYVIDPSAKNRNDQTGRSGQQEFMDNGVVTILGQNSVPAGINRVKERLQHDPPRLQVMAHCVELLGQFKRYRWVSEGRGEGEAKDAPLKKDDHCFVAGTLVEAEQGSVPVEDVRIGDRVWTRGGLCTVVAAAPTRTVPVRTLELENGTQLTGTADHPVWVDRDGTAGFRALGSIRYGDILSVWSKQSFTKASPTVATQTPTGDQTATTSDRVLSTAKSRCFTESSGSVITGRSQIVGTSTTLTATHSTTSRTTSRVSAPRSTSGNTGRQSAPLGQQPTRTRSDHSRERGTVHPKAVNGTVSMAAKPGAHERPSCSSATSAGATSTRSPVAQMIDSAPTTARARGDAPAGWTTRTASAVPAATRSESTATQGPSIVRCRALGSRAAGEAKVYNLTVYGHSEYFANGVLVSNCLDALRYVCMLRPLPPPEERRAQTLTMKDRLLRADLARIGQRKPVDHPSGAGMFS